MANITITPGTGAITNTGSDTTTPVTVTGKRSPNTPAISSGSSSSSSSSSSAATSALTAVSMGPGASILDHLVNNELGLKSLVAGNGIQLVEQSHDVMINVVASGGVKLAFIQLTDAPETYSGQAGKTIKVNTAENGLEFDVASGITAFTQLTDVPQSYTGNKGKVLAVNDQELGLVFVDGGSGGSGVTKFIQLSDVPASYSNSGGMFLRVKSDTSGLEFANAPGGGSGAATFIQLTDVPQSYSGQAGKFVSVNSNANGLQFSAAPSGNSNHFEFQLTFDTASPNNPTASANVPSGWSVALNGNQVTVTHNVGSPPKNIVYWGMANLNNVNTWRMRLPSASNEATYPDGAHSTDTFYITINAAVAAADAGNNAKVEVFF